MTANLTETAPARSAGTRTGTLFVTRKFPPSVGGMETLAQDVWRTLGGDAVPGQELVAFGGSNSRLPWWIPTMYWKVLRRLWRRDLAVVLTGDAVVNALLLPVTRLFRVRQVTMVMGKDVVWENRLYRALVLPSLRGVGRVLAISSATRDAAVSAGVPPERTRVVRLGVEVPATTAADKAGLRSAVAERFDVSDGSVVLLAIGRLVARKGVHWFVENVMPRLPERYVLLVAGDGVHRQAVQDAVAARGLGQRVQLLGRVSDDDRELLMGGCDVMVQPNVVVPGDMEGFGLVTVEAAMRYAPVVAADLEGLRDAVIDGETGLLVPSGDADAWAAALEELAADPARLAARGVAFGDRCRTVYSREHMGRLLRRELVSEV